MNEVIAAVAAESELKTAFGHIDRTQCESVGRAPTASDCWRKSTSLEGREGIWFVTQEYRS